MQVSEQIAAKSIPAIGAVLGAMVNTVFIDHFQQVAHGHFTVRRLERQYGQETVEAAYQAIDVTLDARAAVPRPLVVALVTRRTKAAAQSSARPPSGMNGVNKGQTCGIFFHTSSSQSTPAARALSATRCESSSNTSVLPAMMKSGGRPCMSA